MGSKRSNTVEVVVTSLVSCRTNILSQERSNSIKNIKTTRITFYRSLGVYPCIKHVLDVFYWLIIDFLESNNLGEVDPKIVDLVGITARQPTDKISIFKTFYVPIKHFMSKSTVFVSNLIYFSKKKK